VNRHSRSGVIPEHWPRRESSHRANDGSDVSIAVLLAVIDGRLDLLAGAERSEALHTNRCVVREDATRSLLRGRQRAPALCVVPPLNRRLDLEPGHHESVRRSGVIPERWPSQGVLPIEASGRAGDGERTVAVPRQGEDCRGLRAVCCAADPMNRQTGRTHRMKHRDWCSASPGLRLGLAIVVVVGAVNVIGAGGPGVERFGSPPHPSEGKTSHGGKDQGRRPHLTPLYVVDDLLVTPDSPSSGVIPEHWPRRACYGPTTTKRRTIRP